MLIVKTKAAVPLREIIEQLLQISGRNIFLRFMQTDRCRVAQIKTEILFKLSACIAAACTETRQI